MDPRVGYSDNGQAQSAHAPVAKQALMGSYQHQHALNVIPQNERQPAQSGQPVHMQHMQTMQTSVPPPPPAILLPPGWITATDPVSGRIYYANPSTGQTSWEPPMPPVAVPAPQIMLPPPPPKNNGMNMHISNNSHCNNAPGSNLGQPSYTPMSVQSTLSLNAAHLLIPSTRAMINKVLSQNQARKAQVDSSSTPDNSNNEQKEDITNTTAEFHMTAGKIADLSHIQTNYRHEIMHHMEKQDIDAKYTYEPLKPFSLPVISAVPHVEGGRVDIRLMTLMETLGKIEKGKSEASGSGTNE